MKYFSGLLLTVCLAAGSAMAAPAPILRGVLDMGDEKLFSLSDVESGQASWVAMGKTFNDWKLTGFDAKTSTLTLSKDGETLKVSLASAVIADANDKAAGTLASAEALMDQMRFDEMMEKTMEQQRDAMVKSMKQMMGQMGGGADADAMAEFQGKVFDVMMKEMDLPGMKKDVAKIYADTFTQSELRGMADFYNTPTGTAMLDKQPEIQQKMMQIMMPRMMAAMPKIQQMGQEFAQQQAAQKSSEK